MEVGSHRDRDARCDSCQLLQSELVDAVELDAAPASIHEPNPGLLEDGAAPEEAFVEVVSPQMQASRGTPRLLDGGADMIARLSTSGLLSEVSKVLQTPNPKP